MSNKSRSVLILLTPFQLDQLSKIQEQYSIDFGTLYIFHSEIVSQESIEDQLRFEHAKWIKLPPITANFAKIIQAPWSEIPRHRRYISNLKDLIRKSLNEAENISELWIGTEKDIFTQLLIKHLDCLYPNFKLIAFEEGLGFYSERSKKDIFKKRIYPIITRLFFGFTYEYIVSLGTFHRINELYARFPDDLPYKTDSVKYHKIDQTSLSDPHPPIKDVLYIGAPLSEAKVCSLEKEKELLDIIFSALNDKALSGDIKGHPREIMKKYEAYESDKIRLLDHRMSAENIDYFDYSCVVNLGSSVILDIYQCDYPLDRIITLNMEFNYQSLTHKLFEQGIHGKLFSNDLRNKFDTYLQTLFP